MNPTLNIAIRAIRKAGNFLAQNYDQNNLFLEKKKILENNYIKNIENKIFQIIFKIINQAYPKHDIIFSNNIEKIKKKNITWIIYPLNGKLNFITKNAYFCIAIVLKDIDNHICISVIYDPIKNDLFTSIKGKGSYLNGFRIRCHEFIKNKFNLIVLNFNHIQHKNIKIFFSFLKSILKEKIYFRQSGSKILDLAYLAAGKIAGYIDFSNNYDNILPGILQIKESGALITDFSGGFNYIHESIILTGHSTFLKFIFKKIYFLKKE